MTYFRIHSAETADSMKTLEHALLSPFDEKNMPLLVSKVFPLWNVSGMSEKFNRLYVEMIIHTNMHQNALQFEMKNKTSSLQAISFFAHKNDMRSDIWFNSAVKKLSDSEKTIFTNGRKYLLMMDEKVFSLMGADDLKLCLFISLEKGWGTRILRESLEKIQNSSSSFSKENPPLLDAETSHAPRYLWLWTDGECNVSYYIENNFELISKEEYKPFSSATVPYMTYIFRKEL